MAEAFLKLYPVRSDADAPAMFNAVMRDYERASMYFWAVDRQKTSKTRAYTYYWTHAIPGPEKDRWGAFHCSEIPYFLNTLNESPRPFEAIDHQIADAMSSYYVNFVATGDPNGSGLAAWPAIDPANPATMELGDHYRPIPIADKARFELLKKFFAGQREFR
jgi:para-nitrobenzyl esterase